MVHLIATLANDADHTPSLLHALKSETLLADKNAGEVWGVGYYAEDRALIIRKPAELLTSRSVFELAPNVQSSIVLACVQNNSKLLEHAPPHRFRNWLFGYAGDLTPLMEQKNRIADKLPDFVVTEIGSSSPGALMFGMFIAELQRNGLLQDPLANHAAYAQAMHRTVDAVRMLATEAGATPPQAAYVATNGRVVIASRCGSPLFAKTQEGLESSPYGPTDPDLGEFKRLAEALKRFRAIILTKDVIPGRTGWNEVQEGSTIYFDRKLTIQKV